LIRRAFPAATICIARVMASVSTDDDTAASPARLTPPADRAMLPPSMLRRALPLLVSSILPAAACAPRIGASSAPYRPWVPPKGLALPPIDDGRGAASRPGAGGGARGAPRPPAPGETLDLARAVDLALWNNPATRATWQAA